MRFDDCRSKIKPASQILTAWMFCDGSGSDDPPPLVPTLTYPEDFPWLRKPEISVTCCKSSRIAADRPLYLYCKNANRVREAEEILGKSYPLTKAVPYGFDTLCLAGWPLQDFNHLQE